MAASAALACSVGLGLGILAVTDAVPGDRWTLTVQAHGSVQLFGWVAVFLCTLLFEFVVRLNQSDPLPFRSRLAAIALLGGGAIVQATGQVFHDEVGWLHGPGAVATLVGAIVAALLVLRVRTSLLVKGDFHPWWFRAAVCWLVFASAAKVLSAFRAENGVVELAESSFVLEAVLRGFVMSAIVGVGLRAFAGHLGLRPVLSRRQMVIFAGLNGSAVLWLAGSGAFGLPDSSGLQRAADVVMAIPAVLLTVWLGVLQKFRLDLAPPRYRFFLPWAWAGFATGAIVLVVVAVLPDWGERTIYEEGSARHLLFLGFMGPMMIGMSHIVLARFGTGGLEVAPALAFSFILMQIAWPLRVLPVLANDAPGDLACGIITAGGIAAAASLALLAYAAGRTAVLMRRAAKKHQRD